MLLNHFILTKKLQTTRVKLKLFIPGTAKTVTPLTRFIRLFPALSYLCTP